MIKKFIENLLFLFYLILGILIIIFVLYRRVIVIRLPRDLFFIQDGYLDYRVCFLAISSIILFSLIIYQNAALLINNIPSENLISKFSKNLAEIIGKALEEVYGFIVNRISNIYDKVSYFAQKFYKYFKNISETFFLFFSYIIRFFILACFLCDVFIFFQLNWMYKSLYLLCFSLFIKVSFYVLRDFASNLSTMKSLLIIEDCGINAETGLPITNYTLKEEYKDLDLDYHVEQFILCSKVSGYLDMYDRYSAFFNPRFNIIIYFTYLIGWSFVLYKNLLLI